MNQKVQSSIVIENVAFNVTSLFSDTKDVADVLLTVAKSKINKERNNFSSTNDNQHVLLYNNVEKFISHI